MAFEMLKADAALPSPTLSGDVDAAFPTPGLSLVFGRQFYQSISGRYRMGTLGRGWVSNWDINATTDASGDVNVSDAGVPRTFTMQPDGTFLALPGDHGTLLLTEGVYQLRETDGTITRFRADGKLDYVQDTNGNRITAGYNAGGQLVSLTHSDGERVTIAY